jgi:L-threonylcarbamoyladenylate synthase
MVIIATSADAPTEQAMNTARRALESGDIVAIPTDTVYELIADVSYTGAADRIFAMKRRTREDELSVLVSDMDQALTLTLGAPIAAERLMEKFWPGALTLVLPRHPDFVADLGSDDATVGLRCPDKLIARLLAEDVGPVAMTTANMKGQTPATTAQQVVDIFGEAVNLVLDGGECSGQAATVVDVTGSEPKLLREGAVAWTDIQDVIS